MSALLPRLLGEGWPQFERPVGRRWACVVPPSFGAPHEPAEADAATRWARHLASSDTLLCIEVGAEGAVACSTRKTPSGVCLHEPQFRGYGASALLAAATISQQDPYGILVLVPQGSAAESEEALLDAAERAADWVERYPHQIAIVVSDPASPAAPTASAAPYGWVALRESPDAGKVVLADLFPAGGSTPPPSEGWVNTSLVVARVDTLLRLGKIVAPAWWYGLTTAASRGDLAALDDTYARLPRLRLGRDLLARAPHQLVASPAPNARWHVPS